MHSFDEVLFMDADVNVLLDPSEVFEFPPFRKTGALLWKDYWRLKWMDFRHAQKVFNLTEDELSDWSGGNTGSYLGAYEEDTPHRNRKHRPFEFTMDRIHYEHHTSYVFLCSCVHFSVFPASCLLPPPSWPVHGSRSRLALFTRSYFVSHPQEGHRLDR